MDKQHAINLLGGTVTDAARAVGVTPGAICNWPDVLPARLSDRVLAAFARKHLKVLIREVEDTVKPATI